MEAKWDELNIEVDYKDEISYHSDKDFEITYHTSQYDLDQCFSHRPELKQLFNKNFKFVVLKSKSKFVKHLTNDYWCRHPALRSPETNICGSNHGGLTVFIDESNNLYCYKGCSFYKSTNTFNFIYLGKIIT